MIKNYDKVKSYLMYQRINLSPGESDLTSDDLQELGD